ncbi:hypothetical protein SEENIN0B_03047 [Salmonella enterica subsp. enterica serovar Infantis str. SARB27]|uniref:Uncharacterized protein n=1 Tax=Salmonella enterica subsp. enterica serovar Infantis str. SARB27 TaxID=596155 RepID=A0A6C8GCQ5_SALIN|nr:hypothetical protein SEENIN0B_03047 [Salmonella enterica subsp. enterica serovar Infantis str. SARB27]
MLTGVERYLSRIILKLLIDTQQYNNHITNLLKKQIFAPDIINNIN